MDSCIYPVWLPQHEPSEKGLGNRNSECGACALTQRPHSRPLRSRTRCTLTVVSPTGFPLLFSRAFLGVLLQEPPQLRLALAGLLQPVLPPYRHTRGRLRQPQLSPSREAGELLPQPVKLQPRGGLHSKGSGAPSQHLPWQCWITRPHSRFLRRQARCPTISRCRLPRVRATFMRCSESMKPTCLVRTQDRTTTSFSAPWKASTVDTCTAVRCGRSRSTAPSRWHSCG